MGSALDKYGDYHSYCYPKEEDNTDQIRLILVITLTSIIVILFLISLLFLSLITRAKNSKKEKTVDISMQQPEVNRRSFGMENNTDNTG